MDFTVHTSINYSDYKVSSLDLCSSVRDCEKLIIQNYYLGEFYYNEDIENVIVKIYDGDKKVSHIWMYREDGELNLKIIHE